MYHWDDVSVYLLSIHLYFHLVKLLYKLPLVQNSRDVGWVSNIFAKKFGRPNYINSMLGKVWWHVHIINMHCKSIFQCNQVPILGWKLFHWQSIQRRSVDSSLFAIQQEMNELLDKNMYKLRFWKSYSGVHARKSARVQWKCKQKNRVYFCGSYKAVSEEYQDQFH